MKRIDLLQQISPDLIIHQAVKIMAFDTVGFLYVGFLDKFNIIEYFGKRIFFNTHH